MKTLKKIHLSDLVKEEILSPEKLATLKGGWGIELLAGCKSYVCAEKRSGAADLCAGDAWCVTAVGPETPYY